MKYLKQFGIILFISLVGELLHFVIDLPVPSSIYGIVIMFCLLEFRYLKVEDVSETALFLIEIMPIMFIPAAVGLIESWDMIAPSLVSYIIITVVSTVLVMGISGVVTQIFVKKTRAKGEK